MAAIPYNVGWACWDREYASSGSFVTLDGVAYSYALEIGRVVDVDDSLRLIAVRDVKRSATTTRHIRALQARPHISLTDNEYHTFLTLSESEKQRFIEAKYFNTPYIPRETETLRTDMTDKQVFEHLIATEPAIASLFDPNGDERYEREAMRREYESEQEAERKMNAAGEDRRETDSEYAERIREEEKAWVLADVSDDTQKPATTDVLAVTGALEAFRRMDITDSFAKMDGPAVVRWVRAVMLPAMEVSVPPAFLRRDPIDRLNSGDAFVPVDTLEQEGATFDLSKPSTDVPELLPYFAELKHAIRTIDAWQLASAQFVSQRKVYEQVGFEIARALTFSETYLLHIAYGMLAGANYPDIADVLYEYLKDELNSDVLTRPARVWYVEQDIEGRIMRVNQPVKRISEAGSVLQALYQLALEREDIGFNEGGLEVEDRESETGWSEWYSDDDEDINTYGRDDDDLQKPEDIATDGSIAI